MYRRVSVRNRGVLFSSGDPATDLAGCPAGTGSLYKCIRSNVDAVLISFRVDDGGNESQSSRSAGIVGTAMHPNDPVLIEPVLIDPLIEPVLIDLCSIL
jgi:hypothetical protein